MNITSKYTTRKHVHLASFVFALSLGGCYDAYPAPAEQSTGGSANAPAATGGDQAIPDPGADAGSGGAPDTDTSDKGGSATGGRTEAGGGTETGGATETGETGGSPGAGGSPAVGGSDDTGGTSTGGSSVDVGGAATGGAATGGAATGGAATGGAQPTGGTASTGGAGQGGSAGAPEVLESICIDEEGAPVPYDYSFGLASEYAFELSMSCDVGGYLMPLIIADPEQLSQVNAFVAEATDWYRSEILKCKNESTPLGQDSFGLLPVSESNALSEADFDAGMSLFLVVLDRHDGQPDAVSKQKKDKIKKRIKSVKTRAVNTSTVGLTKTLSEPDCMPAAPGG